MSISGVRDLASFLLLSAAVLHGLRPAFAQATNPSGEQMPEAQPASSTKASPDVASANQQPSSNEPAVCGVAHLDQCLKDFGHDQAGIWTSPLHISPRDAFWLVPFAAATGVALHYDPQTEQDIGINKHRIDVSNKISDFGSPYATAAGAGGLYFLGLATHNDHLSETGRLGVEAIADAAVVVEVLTLATNRQRPNEGNGQGDFWPRGTRSYQLDGSFPSQHAAASWALARVIASEYRSKPVQFAAYAFALAISASRLTARQHFPSDVLVGGTFGYLIGGYVLRHHGPGSDISNLLILPISDPSTRTFGAHVRFTPSERDWAMLPRLIARIQNTN